MCITVAANKKKYDGCRRMPTFVILAQGLALLAFLANSIAACLLHLPLAVLRCSLNSLCKAAGNVNNERCTFFEGSVYHERQKPVHNIFR
jgi:hypothetical protein